MPGTLRIRRLRAECRFTGPPEMGSAIRERATRVACHYLVPALQGTLKHWLNRNDEGVWLVRRLACSVVLPADADPDATARAIALALCPALGAALTGDGDGADTIRFASRTMYVARFLVDAAAGGAWGRWYYAPFADLRMLGDSAAMRTLLVADPECGQQALAQLDDQSLARVAATLSPEDETRILEAFTRDHTAADAGATFSAAWKGCLRAWQTVVVERVLPAFIRAELPHPPPALVDAIRTLTQLQRIIATRPTIGGLGALERRVAGVAPSVPRPILRAMLEERAAPDETRTVTPFGGLLLLLRDLDALSSHKWTARWPSPPAGSAAGVLRWLTACLCSGSDRAAAALADEGLRTLCLGSGAPGLEKVTRWLARVGANRRRTFLAEIARSSDRRGRLSPRELAWLRFPRDLGIQSPWNDAIARIASLVLRSFARRLPGFADSEPDYLWRNFLAFDATLEPEPERVVVRCGRPPLHLVLAVTGMTRGLEAGRDVANRPILMFPRE